jgi:hypothetical protein
MKVPAAKDKVVKSCRLRSIDGVRDVQIGRSTVENRLAGRPHVTGAGTTPPDVKYSDEDARAERYGRLPF